jgi:hypothetical protein
VATYYFNVHSIQAFEKGAGKDAKPLNIDDLDEAGLALLTVVERALNATKGQVVDDAAAKVRLEVVDVWTDELGGISAKNAWVTSGRYGDPFNVRDANGSIAFKADTNHDASRPTLLRFEPDPANDQVLYASGRYGSHGVFARFADLFEDHLRHHAGDSIRVAVEPVADSELLKALLDEATTNEFGVIVPRYISEPADYFAERRPSRAKKAKAATDVEAQFTIKMTYTLNLGRRLRLKKNELPDVLESAAERRKLAKLVLGTDDDEALTGAELRIPLTLKSGKPKTITLPVTEHGIGGRLGFDVSGAVETDYDGYPTRDWLSQQAHSVLADLRAPTT